jgi:glycosyltransferase involved in cell wall biosynthesis
MAGLLPNEMPIPRLLSVHDSWTLRCREILHCSQDFREKAYYSMLAFLEPRYERLAYSQYDRCLVVADRDKVALERTLRASGKVCVIPHGIDLEYFTPATVEKQEQTLVFHGNLAYSPNVEAAVELAGCILPGIRRAVPKATLRLVGADPVLAVEALGSQGQVTIMANLPDLRHAVCSAEVYACPVRHGSGIKNKILEAMAMQMPVVAYAPAVQGINCIHGKHLLIADSQESFIRSVVQLFQDRAQAEQLGRAARLLMESQYSWEARVRTYEELCTEVQTEWQQSHYAGLRKGDKADDGSMNAYSH